MFCTACGGTIDGSASFCPACGARVGAAATSAPLAAGAPVPELAAMEYAPWATRVGGDLIDSILVGVGMGILFLVAGGILTSIARIGGENAAGGTCCMVLLLFPLATLVVGLYNHVYLVSQRGYFMGQGVVHVKVVDTNGRLISQGTALVRLIAKAAFGFVPLLPLLDLLWPLWDPCRQTLHDKAVGSYVIENPERIG